MKLAPTYWVYCTPRSTSELGFSRVSWLETGMVKLVGTWGVECYSPLLRSVNFWAGLGLSVQHERERGGRSESMGEREHGREERESVVCDVWSSHIQHTIFLT